MGSENKGGLRIKFLSVKVDCCWAKQLFTITAGVFAAPKKSVVKMREEENCIPFLTVFLHFILFYFLASAAEQCTVFLFCFFFIQRDKRCKTNLAEYHLE